MQAGSWVLTVVALCQAESSPPRPLYELNREVRAVCQRDAQARPGPEKSATTYEMAMLYREIWTDPRYVSSGTLQEYRARLWSRLNRTKQDLRAQLRREGRLESDWDDLPANEAAVAWRVTQSVGEHLDLIGATLGGPAGVFSQAGGHGGRAGPPDYGPDLVDLIQRTIKPDFWDVHGGPGTIVYYRPLQCLVVRATSEVHHHVGGAVSALRGSDR
ncbi:MAG: hypothetical protein AB7F89_08235 [Pirellulaceae bacterium]